MASQYVVLEQADEANVVRVVVHTDVPATGTNQVGTQWQTAVSQWRAGAASAVPVAILPAGRQTDLDNGLFHEWSLSVEYDRNETNANKQAALEAEISARAADELTEMQNILQFWGATGSVA